MLDSVESSTSAAIAAALAHRPQDLSIYSNSWGYRTSGMYVASTHDAIAAVIYSGIKNVRKPHTGIKHKESNTNIHMYVFYVTVELLR